MNWIHGKKMRIGSIIVGLSGPCYALADYVCPYMYETATVMLSSGFAVVLWGLHDRICRIFYKQKIGENKPNLNRSRLSKRRKV